MTLEKLSKKTLCKMRTAVKTTISLHKEALETGKSYAVVENERSVKLCLFEKGIDHTPLCAFAYEMKDTDCSICPFTILGGVKCSHKIDEDSRFMAGLLIHFLNQINAEIETRSKQ